jgi:hypothetical protein
VTATGRRKSRSVLVRVDLSTAGSVRARLMRGGRTFASLRRAVGARPARLRLHVPASAPAGRYTLEVVATGGRKSQRVVRTLMLHA